MKQRIMYPKARYYKNYGGRGIKICDEWLGKEGFSNFFEWAISNGYKDNLTIDRIDVDGNYEPSNCRWVTKEKQNYNKKNNCFIVYKKQRKTIAEWSKELGFKPSVLGWRIRNGWSIEEALTKPVRKRVNR